MIIYCTTNLINGKKYIGLDRRNCPTYLGSGKRLRQALKKYGRCNFKKQILQFCESIEDLRESEVYWIQYFNAVKSNLFYNINEGGSDGSQLPSRKGIKQSEQHRRNRSIANQGKPHPLTKESCIYCNKISTRTNIVQYHNSNCEKNPSLSSENLLALKKARSDRNYRKDPIRNELVNRVHFKKVVQLSLVDRIYIETFESLESAKAKLNLKSTVNISSNIHGRQKTAEGFVWITYDNYQQLILNKTNNNA